MIELAAKYSSLVEDTEIPLKRYAVTFLAIVSLRNFVEIFSDRSQLADVSFAGHAHFYLSYICLALTLMVLFSTATGETVPRTARLIMVSFFFVLSAPIFDLLLSLGQGHKIAYLMTFDLEDILRRYLTYGGSFESAGITIGLKLEGVLVLTASYVYLKAKGLTTLKSLASVLAIYTVVFVYALVPVIIRALLGVFHVEALLTDHMLYVKFYLLLSLAFTSLLAWRWNRRFCIDVLKHTRPSRQLHAQSMLALGLILGPRLVWSQDTFFDLLLVAISILFACLFTIIINALGDQESNRTAGRACCQAIGTIPLDTCRAIGIAAGLIALLFAGAVGYYTAFTLLLCMGLFYVYAMPPLRIKRIPILAKLPATLGSLACVILGYTLASGEVIDFPPLIIAWFLLCFAAAVNLIDVKDYEQDKRAGIRTLPVLWGLRRSQIVIGLLLLLAYVSAPFAFGQVYLIPPAAAVGLIQCYLVGRRDYEEKPVFVVYLLSLVTLSAILWISKGDV